MNDGAQTPVVATPQAGTTPAAEPNTLDGLIQEFNKGTAPEVSTAVTKVLSSIKPLVEHVERQQTKEISDQITKDFDSAAAELKSVAGADTLTPRALKGYMREYAAEVPEVEKAWNNRQAEPAAWQAALGRVKTALAEDLKATPTSTLKTDVLAARAAVANSSQTPIPSQEISLTEKANMSDRDWNNYLRGRIGTAQRR